MMCGLGRRWKIFWTLMASLAWTSCTLQQQVLALVMACGCLGPTRLWPRMASAWTPFAKMSWCCCGRGADMPVIVLMGRFGGEGKSFLLSPLRNVYGPGNIQATPQRGSFPLLGLESKKVVLLDDWCFDEAVLTLPTQLLWYEGKPFPLPRPQNSAQYNGHLLYQGTAPIFVTVKEKDLGPIIAQSQVALAQGVPSEHTMLMRRLKIYSFTKPLPRSSRHIVECPSCFAKLLLRYGLWCPINAPMHLLD